MCKLIFCSDGSLARLFDQWEQDAPTTNLFRAKLGCSPIKNHFFKAL
ncbi:hypothetical protein NIES2100_06710 [Calothrix sp. NIES-2100]|nr:hypothetical protein NIES2100_06710 [Calothrix sp. NIES-2100]